MREQPARRVAIIGGTRIPFCRAHTHYRHASNQDMLTASLRGLVDKFDLAGAKLGDVALGAVIKHSRDWNLAREAVLSSGLSPETPAFDLQRACGTSLEAAILIGSKISVGLMDAGIAGGSDSISDVPIVFRDGFREVVMASARGRSLGAKLKPWLSLRPRHLKPQFPGVDEPRTKLSMGASTEVTAKEWNISREDQDELALHSHQNAASAYDEGFYDDLVIPFADATEDNNIRRDSSLEKLAKLKPVFDKSPRATMTAGNSTPLTDGSAAVLAEQQRTGRANGSLEIKAGARLTHLRQGRGGRVRQRSTGLLMAPAYSAVLGHAQRCRPDAAGLRPLRDS